MKKKLKKTFTVDSDVYNAVKNEADKQERSVSYMVNKAIKEMLNKLSKGKNKA